MVLKAIIEVSLVHAVSRDSRGTYMTRWARLGIVYNVADVGKELGMVSPREVLLKSSLVKHVASTI